MQLSEKQEELIRAYKSGRYKTFALGGGTGCVDGSTLVYDPKNQKYRPIREYRSGEYVRAYDYTQKTFHDVACDVPGPVDKRPLYKVTARTKTKYYTIICTMDHKFLRASRGYVQKDPKAKLPKWSTLRDLSVKHYVGVYTNENEVEYAQIYSIVFEKLDYYYDLHVPVYHNYLAQGFVNHNSAKTIGILNLLHVICMVVPNVRYPIFRKSEKNLKNNTIPSFKKVLQMRDEKVLIRDFKAQYPNGSELLFLWADETKDPDFDNVKGGEYTGAFFNEANQIAQGYYEICKTRVGRWNKVKLQGNPAEVKASLFLDFNPTDNWVKQTFYDPSRNGTLPPDVFFQLSLPKDNPFLSADYMAMLETLPPAEYARYVLGNWDYGDDPQQLIQYSWVKDNELDPTETLKGEIYLAVDVARYGDDRTVFAYMQGGSLFKFEEFKKISTTETANILMLRMQEYGIQQRNVIVDVVGLGAGVVDTLKDNGLEIYPFGSGEKPTMQSTNDGFFQFSNKKTQAHWYFREALRLGQIGVLNHPDFVAEATTQRYEITDKVIRVEEKDSVKKRLKRSPDYLDAAVMVNFIRHKQGMFEELDLDKIKQPSKVIDIFDKNVNMREVLRW